MKNQVLLWEIGGFFFIGLVGAALHFTFELSNFSNMVVAFFSAVNESTWEHLKMVFWPGLFFALIEYSYIRDRVNNFLIAKTFSLFVMPMIIIIGWYGYTPFTQRSIFQLDLLLFYVAVFIGQYLSYKLLTRASLSERARTLSAAGLLLMILAFSTFTFYPPQMFLFENFDLLDTGQYGILDNYDNMRYFTTPPPSP
jgi:hypothetical protein